MILICKRIHKYVEVSFNHNFVVLIQEIPCKHDSMTVMVLIFYNTIFPNDELLDKQVKFIQIHNL